MTASNPWPVEMVDALRQMYVEGMSANQTADALCKQFTRQVSRNGVIGKWHRLELDERPETKTRAKRTRVRPAKREARKITVFRQASANGHLRLIESISRGPPQMRAASVEARHILIADLTSMTCRFPFGDGGPTGFTFCGCEPIPGLPYCAPHVRLTREARRMRVVA